MQNNAVQGNHPPRLNSSNCGNNNIAAVGLNQSDFKINKRIDIQQGRNMNQVTTINPSSDNYFNPKQIEILKNSICKGVSNEEFEVFLMACVKTQLDPFMRQIYAVKRKAKKPDGTWGESMTIQTGIDGYRLIAERTEKYSPGPEPTYQYDSNGNLLSATSYIKKLTNDGTWHEVSASAYIDEYCQTFIDKQTGHKKPSGMWATMPRTMLSKCAEAQALRKAFPAEMSGVYTKEEMEQAEVLKITLEQASEIEMILDNCEQSYKKWVYNYIKKTYSSENICDIPAEFYERMKTAALNNMESYSQKLKAEQTPELLLVEAQ